jgi:hypothetical protein
VISPWLGRLVVSNALQDVTLNSALRQLRDGYPGRSVAFPWSLAIVGMRDVRDYKVASGGSERLHTASPFNIKTEWRCWGRFWPSGGNTASLSWAAHW